VDICFLIQYFCNTTHTCHTHRDHNKNHRKHHKTHKNIHTIGKKTHQFSGCKRIHNNHFRTEPADQNNTGVNCKHHDRCIPDNILLCFYKNIINILACTLKFTCLFLFPYIRLYNADCRNIFLNRLIQCVIFRKCLLEICSCMTDNKKQNNSKNQDCHKINTCQPCIDCKCHHHRTYHTCRCSHHHT